MYVFLLFLLLLYCCRLFFVALLFYRGGGGGGVDIFKKQESCRTRILYCALKLLKTVTTISTKVCGQNHAIIGSCGVYACIPDIQKCFLLSTEMYFINHSIPANDKNSLSCRVRVVCFKIFFLLQT